jgi:hypothetical protein
MQRVILNPRGLYGGVEPAAVIMNAGTWDGNWPC